MKSASGGRRSGRFFGAGVMAVLSIALIVYEWDYGHRRVPGEAVVTESSYAAGRSGLMLTGVVHRVGGSPVVATLRTFYVRLHAGRTIPVLYLPDDPKSVELDLFWQRHRYSATALAMFAIFVAWGTLNVMTRGRGARSPLLCDDDAGKADVSDILRRVE